MSDFGTPGANAALDGTAIPSALYVKLHTGNPGTNGTSNAATETRRIAVSAWNAASSGTKTNSAICQLSGAAATESITHVSLWSASSGGTCWFVTALAAPLSVTAGQLIQIDAGALSITLTPWA